MEKVHILVRHGISDDLNTLLGVFSTPEMLEAARLNYMKNNDPGGYWLSVTTCPVDSVTPLNVWI